MNLYIILFILLALSIYLGLHGSIYLLLVKFFSPLSRLSKIYILIALAVLSVSFVFSMILSRFSENEFTRIIYIISVMWVGVSVSLLLFFGFGYLFYLLLNAFGITLNLKILGYILLGLLTVYIFYGVVNANNIRLTKINIAIKDLPNEWVGKKIVQITDIHLGVVNRRAFMETVVDKISAIDPETVLITGDLFDDTGDNLADEASPLKKIKVPTYFIAGNHETYLGIDKALAALKDTDVVYLSDKVAELNGLQIAGTEYPNRQARKDIEPFLKTIDQNKPVILLHHEPKDTALAAKYGVDLQLSGHVHNGQLYPIKYFARLIYGKYFYGLHTIGDYTIYSSSGTGTWGPPMRTGSNPEVVEITLNKK
jgi:predicted MPP superfamily phosphohydrolase